MKIRPTETLGSRRVPGPWVLTLPERSVADDDRPAGGAACAQNSFWARPSNYLWATGAVAAGLGLHFYYYYMRDTLVSLALFSVLFFSLSLAVLERLPACATQASRPRSGLGPASRAVVALIWAARPRRKQNLLPVPVVEDGFGLSRTYVSKVRT
jgi:hypothetical protein